MSGFWITAGGGGMSGGGMNQAQCQVNQINQPTLADHIEERMCRMQRDMDRLKQIKKQLSEPNGVLSVSVDDLQFAMRYC